MKAGQSLFSLFAHSPTHAIRGSRLKYRTRFLAAPPAGILEQKRDCLQSNFKVFQSKNEIKIEMSPQPTYNFFERMKVPASV